MYQAHNSFHETPSSILKGYYTPHFHFKTQLYKIFKDNWAAFKEVYPRKYEDRYGELRKYQTATVEKFLSCSNPHNGFSYVACTNDKCREGYIIPFTCGRELCPSCAEKLKLENGLWLSTEVLFNVKHKMTTLTMPNETRAFFQREPKLLSFLAGSAGKMLIRLSRESASGKWSKNRIQKEIPDDAMPGLIIRIETAGGSVNFNPHMHIIETEGCYSPNDSEDSYYAGSFIPYNIIRHRWMNVVLNLLTNFGKINKDYADRLRKKYKKGFNVNSQIRDHAGDPELMLRQAQYIQKAPLSETNIVNYNCKTTEVTVKFRRKDFDDTHKGYATETMSVFELIARLIQHIHYPRMHYTRYQGQYSVKRRGMRRKEEKKTNPVSTNKNRTDYRSSWAKLIWKVYGGDPLACPVCGSKMKIKEIVTKNVECSLRRLNIKIWYYKEGDSVKEIHKPQKKSPKPREP